MNIPNSTLTEQKNGTKAAPTVAERHAFTRAAAVWPGVWAKLRPWLLAGAAGLAMGAAVMGLAAYQVMPMKATAVERVFADVNGDGSPDFIVSGWIVYGPKAAGQ